MVFGVQRKGQGSGCRVQGSQSADMCAEKLKNRARNVFVTAKLAEIPKKNAASNLIFQFSFYKRKPRAQFVALGCVSSFIKQFIYQTIQPTM